MIWIVPLEEEIIIFSMVCIEKQLINTWCLYTLIIYISFNMCDMFG